MQTRLGSRLSYRKGTIWKGSSRMWCIGSRIAAGTVIMIGCEPQRCLPSGVNSIISPLLCSIADFRNTTSSGQLESRWENLSVCPFTIRIFGKAGRWVLTHPKHLGCIGNPIVDVYIAKKNDFSVQTREPRVSMCLSTSPHQGGNRQGLGRPENYSMASFTLSFDERRYPSPHS